MYMPLLALLLLILFSNMDWLALAMWLLLALMAVVLLFKLSSTSPISWYVCCWLSSFWLAKRLRFLLAVLNLSACFSSSVELLFLDDDSAKSTSLFTSPFVRIKKGVVSVRLLAITAAFSILQLVQSRRAAVYWPPLKQESCGRNELVLIDDVLFKRWCSLS